MTGYVAQRQQALGDYTIIKQIGQGSLGEVYLAEHRYMKKQYVLKVLAEEWVGQKGFIQRFEEGVAAIAALDHPNVAKVYNVSYAEGNYFLVTDCIVDDVGETTNLGQYYRQCQGRIDEQILYSLFSQLADALDYIHQQGNGEPLAHSALKPSNIILGKNASTLSVTDVGLARLVGLGAVYSKMMRCLVEDLPSGLAQHRTDDLLLPVHVRQSFLEGYACLAPEQKVGGEMQAAAPATDVYAFGVMVYYMLMGDYPEGVFELPSLRHQGLQHNWDLLIWHCLQRNPARRPSSLQEALKNYLVNSKRPSFSHVSTSTTPYPSPASVQEPVAEPPVQEKREVLSAPPKAPPPAEMTELKPVIRDTEVHRPTYDPNPAAALQVDTSVTQYHPDPIAMENVEPLRSEMVIFQGGEFWRGSTDGNRDEMPKHRVYVKSFSIDIHPVTNEQFVRFLEYMGGEKDANNQDIIRLKDSRIKRRAGKLNIESGYAKHPVVGITWYGAIAYARWIGKRLPTEAEWEMACCNMQEGLLYPTGESIEKTQANFFNSDTTAVKSYPSNPAGLYDMVGNVYEWCHDWYGYNYYEESALEPDNPQGPLQGVYRVLRGGCWKSLSEDLRCSHRHRNNPGTVNSTYGFRCAADVSVD